MNKLTFPRLRCRRHRHRPDLLLLFRPPQRTPQAHHGHGPALGRLALDSRWRRQSPSCPIRLPLLR